MMQLPKALRRLFVATAASTWALSLLLASSFVSWWLTVLLLLVALVGGPRFVRARLRDHRLTVCTHSVSAGWREVCARAIDLGTALDRSASLRESAAQLASEHNFTAEERPALRSLVAVIERDWYSSATTLSDSSSSIQVRPLVLDVLAILDERTPKRRWARWMPPSLWRAL